MSNWINAQFQAIKLVLTRITSQFKSTFLIALVIGIALSLPSIFYVAVDHVSQYTYALKANNEISLFVALNATDNDVSQIKQTLDNHPQVQSSRFVSKADAWDKMQSKMQLGDAETSFLNTNPLPHAFYVQGNASDSESLESLKNDLAQIPNIDHALLNTDWANQLETIIDTAKQVILGFALLLAIGLIVIIGNTIRMQIITQRDEIEVSYLIGATNQFIRTPFLYAGIAYGLLGGFVSIAIVTLSILLLNKQLTSLSDVYHLDLTIANIDIASMLVMFITAIIIGWIGAYFAVNRTIASIIADYNRKA